MKEIMGDDEIKKWRKAILSEVGTEGSNVGAGMPALRECCHCSARLCNEKLAAAEE